MVLFQAIGARWRASMKTYNWVNKNMPQIIAKTSRFQQISGNYPEMEVFCLTQINAIHNIWCADIISLSILILICYNSNNLWWIRRKCKAVWMGKQYPKWPIMMYNILYCWNGAVEWDHRINKMTNPKTLILSMKATFKI